MNWEKIREFFIWANENYTELQRFLFNRIITDAYYENKFKLEKKRYKMGNMVGKKKVVFTYN